MRRLILIDRRFKTSPIVVSCISCDMTLSSVRAFTDGEGIFCENCATDDVEPMSTTMKARIVRNWLNRAGCADGTLNGCLEFFKNAITNGQDKDNQGPIAKFHEVCDIVNIDPGFYFRRVAGFSQQETMARTNGTERYNY